MSRMEKRRLVLYADYFADPLWTEAGGMPAAMVALEDLPLSAELRAKLRTWPATFDSLAGKPGWPSTSAREQWNLEGERLRNLVAGALGQGYSVTYLSYDE
jgi:hypothetical protein